MLLEGEDIKDLICFNIKEGYYKISENGEIYSSVSKKFLHIPKDKDGYLRVLLVCEDGKRRGFGVHRLVAETYLDNPNNYPIVLHLDNNKSNNHYTNLKWGTIQENTQQAYDDGCCTCNKEVYLYDKKHKYLIKKFNSISELARYFGYSQGNISNLGKIARGEKEQYTSGKLKDYIITHKKL